MLPVLAPDMRCVAEEVEGSASSSVNRFGEVVRFSRHQLSIMRICASASGVIRTSRLTAAGAALPEFPRQAEDYLPRPISRTPTALRARRVALH